METKDLIEANAITLWAQKGYDGVGIQEICDVSSITKPSLYHHFKSKAGLLETILSHHLTAYFQILETQGSYKHDITKNLQEIALAWFEEVKNNPNFARLHLVLQAAGKASEAGRSYEPFRKHFSEALETLFLQASEDHGNMKGRSVRYGASYLGLLNTWTTLYLEKELELLNQEVYPLVHQFMHGIFS